MKKALQRRTYSFDTRSVMLFAAISLGGAGALHAQQSTAPAAPPAKAAQFGPVTKGTGAAPTGSAGFSTGPDSPSPAAKAAAATTTAATEAFDRADTNKDGKLSAQEAVALPAISQRFKELDVDQDGSLSRAEFDKGVKS